MASKNNNTKVVKLLITYANQHRIDLKLNDKDYNNMYPLTRTIKNKNIDIKNNLENEEIESENDVIEVERGMSEFERELCRMLRNVLNRETEMKERQNEINNDNLPETPTLVIVTTDFTVERYDSLDIKKGHRKDNEKENGVIPEICIKIYEDDGNKDSGLIFSTDIYFFGTRKTINLKPNGDNINVANSI
ncbi:hypothetical protein PIROE2DRAFT_19433 [Piromyces sp. E2]|nr:hypothetical protein PIROE2DRAFT_19433 [Piromyces sp. E2]|eukprot:OUM56114.1 hypothetical protein PIROE2DRAFT_19433 [Piromyces sp. E2]